MRTNKFVSQMFALLVIAGMVLSACTTPTPAPTEPPAPAPTEPPAPAPTEPPAPVDPMAELVAAAQAEGMLTTIALPPDWCSYGKIIDKFKEKYPGIAVNELNPDAGSGDEIEAIKANMNNKGPQAPDVVDVGFSFGEPNKDLFMPYKVSTWDTIPDGMQSPDGYWYGDYYGVMGFLVNTDVQPDVPKDWPDLLGGAWMNAFRSQFIKDDQMVTPLISNVFNFTKPTADQPSLLSWEEVSTLFHAIRPCPARAAL